MSAGIATERDLNVIGDLVVARNKRAAVRAAGSADPDPVDVTKYMYTDSFCHKVPIEYSNTPVKQKLPEIERDEYGRATYKDAIKEALMEEMARDNRVIFYEEDVAHYGGAFKLTKGLVDSFGRDRVFNAPISEACLCGTAVGLSMTGMRPVVELMYMDFALMASDQISNQMAKWHYMTGGRKTVPVVVRCSVGSGKGYAGQHSQSLETIFAHTPGLKVVYPSNAFDAKSLLKTAIRDDNPVVYIESQILNNEMEVVPGNDYLIPFGKASVKKEGSDISVISWGPAVIDALKAAQQLAGDGISLEVIDIRTLVPFDFQTVYSSVKKTGRCIVNSKAVDIASFTGQIVSDIVKDCFGYLKAPVLKIGAKPGVAPMACVLEKAFYPDTKDYIKAVKELMEYNITVKTDSTDHSSLGMEIEH